MNDHQDLFQNAFTHAAIGMALVGLDGRWLEVNDSLTRIVGYTREELTQRTFQDITHPEDIATDLHQLQQLLDGTIPSCTLEKRYLCRSGKPVWVALTASLVRDANAAPLFFIAQIQDIAAQKMAEADRDAFFDVSPDMLAIAGKDGFFDQVNPVWVRVLGWSALELTAQPFVEFVHPDDRERTLVEATAVYENRPLRGFRNRYLHKEGGYRWLEWNTHVADDGRLYCAARDVTVQQQVQDRLRMQENALQATGSGIFITDPTQPENPIVYCNPAFERITGHRQLDIIGKSCHFLRGEDRDAGPFQTLLDAMAAETECRVVLRNRRRDGALHLTEYMMSPVRDKQGRLLNHVGLVEDITEQVRFEEELRSRELHLRQITASVPALLFQWYERHDGSQGFHYISDKCEELLGIPAAELLEDWTRAPIHPEDAGRFRESISTAARQRTDWYFEGRLLLAEGAVRWVKSCSSVTAVSATEIRFTGVVVDVTELVEAMETARRSTERLRTIADNLPVLVSYIDAEQRFHFCNATYFTWLGADPAALIGQHVREAFGDAMYAERHPYLARALAGEPVHFEAGFTSMGTERRAEITYIPHVENGKVHGVYALASDITASKAVEEQLSRLARHDTLTGLPNRRHFEERLAEAVARSRRADSMLAVMFVDIDHFKAINDSIGHAGGDDVLKELARRLKAGVRMTDTVARLAGDEFIVILEALRAQEEVPAIAEKMLAVVRAPFAVQGVVLKVTVSIGVAFHARGATDADHARLVNRADDALYAAKLAGRDGFRIAT